MLGYLGVSIIHRTLTRTTGSLTCVCDLFPCVYTKMISVYSLIQRTSVEFALDLTPEKSQGGHKAEDMTVTRPFGDHTQLCLTLAFKSEHSCSAPLTLLTVTTDWTLKTKILPLVFRSYTIFFGYRLQSKVLVCAWCFFNGLAAWLSNI